MHDRKELATEGSISFEACDCGTIYFHLGPMTLRLNEAGLANLATAASAARRRMVRTALSTTALQAKCAEA